jgi:two-component system chemotaxis sensor kinase CheA
MANGKNSDARGAQRTMSLDLTRFHATFFAESLEGLNHVEQQLLDIEQRGHDKAGLDAIFRDVHSLKGSAGSLGFGVIAELAHEMESVLDRMREGLMPATAESTNVLLRGVDCLRNWLLAAEAKAPVDGASGASLVRELQLLLQRAGAAQAAAARQNYIIVFRPARDFFHSGNDPARFIDELAQLGEIQSTVDLSALPSIDAFDPTTCYLAWRIALKTQASANDIREVFDWVSNSCALEIELARATDARADESAGPADAARGGDAASGRREANLVTMHVRTDKIDELVNLVGELVITHTMLKQSAQHLDAIKDARAVSVLAQLERNVQDLQERVLAIRMMPVNHVFGRFPRLVRDLGLQLGKAIELKLSGEQAELDKSVIEQLIDPMTHLVRNALDHGIELPAERLAAGKPAKGTLSLHAEHRGGRFVIQVSDDGRGIDAQKVKQRALEAGLVDAADELDEAGVHALLLRPGFSTAREVSNLSGRGVGLDVVSQNVRKLGGSLEIASRRGQGTVFTINLPLTLAIVDGMIVGVSGERYIIPITFIRECLQVSAVQLQSVVGQGQVLQLRGEYIPVLKLADLCSLRASAEAAHAAQSVLVVLEAENRAIALQVDDLLGQDQVVIKSLEANYRKVAFMAGASILGDGRVALILDVTEIIKERVNIRAAAAVTGVLSTSAMRQPAHPAPDAATQVAV